MPIKRCGTHRVTAYLDDVAYQNLTNYVSENYTASNAYGATSQVVNNAVLCFCANAGTKVSYLDTSLMNLVENDTDVYNDFKEVKKENV